jgi:hypothetical protein
MIARVPLLLLLLCVAVAHSQVVTRVECAGKETAFTVTAPPTGSASMTVNLELNKPNCLYSLRLVHSAPLAGVLFRTIAVFSNSAILPFIEVLRSADVPSFVLPTNLWPTVMQTLPPATTLPPSPSGTEGTPVETTGESLAASSVSTTESVTDTSPVPTTESVTDTSPVPTTTESSTTALPTTLPTTTTPTSLPTTVSMGSANPTTTVGGVPMPFDYFTFGNSTYLLWSPDFLSGAKLSDGVELLVAIRPRESLILSIEFGLCDASDVDALDEERKRQLNRRRPTPHPTPRPTPRPPRPTPRPTPSGPTPFPTAVRGRVVSPRLRAPVRAVPAFFVPCFAQDYAVFSFDVHFGAAYSVTISGDDAAMARTPVFLPAAFANTNMWETMPQQPSVLRGADTSVYVTSSVNSALRSTTFSVFTEGTAWERSSKILMVVDTRNVTSMFSVSASRLQCLPERAVRYQWPVLDGAVGRGSALPSGSLFDSRMQFNSERSEPVFSSILASCGSQTLVLNITNVPNASYGTLWLRARDSSANISVTFNHYSVRLKGLSVRQSDPLFSSRDEHVIGHTWDVTGSANVQLEIVTPPDSLFQLLDITWFSHKLCDGETSVERARLTPVRRPITQASVSVRICPFFSQEAVIATDSITVDVVGDNVRALYYDIDEPTCDLTRWSRDFDTAGMFRDRVPPNRSFCFTSPRVSSLFGSTSITPKFFPTFYVREFVTPAPIPVVFDLSGGGRSASWCCAACARAR